MKDDFYKDIQHKRTDTNKDERTRRRSRKNKVDEQFSRSAKYNREENKTVKNENKKENEPKKDDDKSVIAAILASFKSTSSKYGDQFSKEMQQSKSKLKEFKNKHLNTQSIKNNKNKKSLLVLLALLIPLTLVLGVMIVSNFWPSGDGIDEQSVASDKKEENTRQIDKEFESKKAELEKQFAKNKDSNSNKKSKDNKDGEKVASNKDGNLPAKYSEEQIASLEKLGQSVISSKKESDVKKAEQKAAEERERERQAEEAKKKEEEEKKVGATHVVTAQDNLYRIALKYYGAGTEENIQKIRSANGISGNNLTVGQELIIP